MRIKEGVEMVIFGVIDEFWKYLELVKGILILVVNCNLFNQTPSLSTKLLDIHIYLYIHKPLNHFTILARVR